MSVKYYSEYFAYIFRNSVRCKVTSDNTKANNHVFAKHTVPRNDKLMASVISRTNFILI